MALKRMVLQIGMGTDIRGADYTKAAVRALRDALWHNSLSVADAVGLPVDSMQVEVTIGVPRPDQVDKEAVLAVLPHGTGTVRVVEGGLEIPNDARADGFLPWPGGLPRHLEAGCTWAEHRYRTFNCESDSICYRRRIHLVRCNPPRPVALFE